MKNTSKSTKAPVSAKMIKGLTTAKVGKVNNPTTGKKPASKLYITEKAVTVGKIKTKTDQLKKTSQGMKDNTNRYGMGAKMSKGTKGNKAV